MENRLCIDERVLIEYMKILELGNLFMYGNWLIFFI